MQFLSYYSLKNSPWQQSGTCTQWYMYSVVHLLSGPQTLHAALWLWKLTLVKAAFNLKLLASRGQLLFKSQSWTHVYFWTLSLWIQISALKASFLSPLSDCVQAFTFITWWSVQRRFLSQISSNPWAKLSFYIFYHLFSCIQSTLLKFSSFM